MVIRRASAKDINDLTSLMEQLGYPTSVEQMRIRFKHIEEASNHYTLVAEYDGKVVGMIGFHTGVLYNSDGIYARVIAFVVDSNYRNKGIGRRLLSEAEKYAKNLGSDGIGLNSGNRAERENAHQFYKKMGYSVKSTGFVKRLF
ncbi:GNAT family N-acetyltransferase [Metabacillus halosaccharovorans]|uniref:GNAT family N-acetyltransferase n=1 Tax=Metabacillus halosaccharovorans TaxID=930124 RepID=A0ABT3DJF8_9BACI|nr:GNAT family N-acetyltransferase [Metabacillus halosaccharovorans]MCV9887189.1 GNAT family N-acetyltransferase [Metabacillus halosaccharovorans]